MGADRFKQYQRSCDDGGVSGGDEMTDRELRCRCFEAIDFNGEVDQYNPLENDGQAMALIKMFRLEVYYDEEHPAHPWMCVCPAPRTTRMATDLNRAICECVAAIRAMKVDK